MKIKRFRFANVKGMSADFTPGPITVFVGDNGAGKTAHADALTVGMIGYHPKLGKRNADTIELCSGQSMGVTLDFEDGRTNRVQLKRTKTGATGEVTIGVPCPAVMLDFGDYLKHSGPERVRYLFDRLGKKLDVNAVIAAIKQVKIEPHTAEAEADIAVVCQRLNQKLDPKLSPAEWFSAALDAVKELRSESAADQKQCQAAFDAEVAHAAQTPVVLVRDNIEQLVAEAKAAQGSLIGRVGELRGELAVLEQTRESREKIKASMSTPNPAEKIAALVAKQNELKVEMAKLGAEESSELGVKLALARQEAKRAKADAVRERESIAAGALELETNLRKGCCPTCGVESDAWKNRLKEQWEQSLRLKENLVKELDEKLASWEKKVARLETLKAKQDADDAAKEKLENDFDELANELSVLQEIASDRARAAELSVAVRDEVVVKAELDASERSLLLASEKWSGLLQEQQSGINRRAAEQRKQTALDRRDAAERKVKVCDGVKAALLASQQKEVDDVLKPLLSLAGKLTQSVRGWRLEFRDGEIGYTHSTGQWISQRSFCGSDERLAFAGMQMALAHDSPVKVLVLDELGTIYPKNKGALLREIEQLVAAGLLDHFFGFDVSTDGLVDGASGLVIVTV